MSDDWRDFALCTEVGGEPFFPEKGVTAREAKRTCGRCEVKAECLEWALSHNIEFGVWGGMSEEERRKLKSRGAGVPLGQAVAQVESERAKRQRTAEATRLANLHPEKDGTTATP